MLGRNNKVIKHFFFDLDGTLCKSRQPIEQDMIDALIELSKHGEIIIVSGSKRSQIIKQIGGFVPYLLMAQSGADCAPYWNKSLSVIQCNEVKDHISKMMDRFPYVFSEYNGKYNDPRLLIENRGAQITLGIVPSDTDANIKKDIDPVCEMRLGMLDILPFESVTGMICTIGGSTSFDYTMREYRKGGSIKKLLELKGWSANECAYFGDALFSGGNDSSVLSVIDLSILVESPEKTLEWIRGICTKNER